MSSRPNILLVMTDRQRYDTLRWCGFAGPHDPHDVAADYLGRP